ncbi:uncharacterized protein [Struthio camelus]|uniref:uncharacterized protein n=1 Tax=Struthio camelus TaxID=8801 RepID=UPI003603DFAD
MCFSLQLGTTCPLGNKPQVGLEVTPGARVPGPAFAMPFASIGPCSPAPWGGTAMSCVSIPAPTPLPVGRKRRRASSRMNFLSQVSAVVKAVPGVDGLFLQPWSWLRAWVRQVSSSRQAVAGAASTAAFFLCEGLLGQHFEVVPNGVAEPQPGDLFLFPLASTGPGWWGAHAGVYCGNGEIIHLEGAAGPGSGPFPESRAGIVAKHGKSHLLRTRGPAKVLRKKGGLDQAALQRRVRVAMDEVVEYNAVTCNCVHFALALLGLGQLAVGTISPTLQ